MFPALGKAQLNLPDILDFNLEHNPDFPVFIYGEISSSKTTEIKMLEYVRAAHRVGKVIRGDSQTGDVIGIVANLDTIVYSALIVGIMKAGLVVSRPPIPYAKMSLFSHSAISYISTELPNRSCPSHSKVICAQNHRDKNHFTGCRRWSQSRARNDRPELCTEHRRGTYAIRGVSQTRQRNSAGSFHTYQQNIFTKRFR